MAVSRGRIAALALLASACAIAPAHAFDAASLWRTDDQRGDALLSKGDAAAAAKTYRDPRRRAYARAQAGDHAAAARDLAPLDDADAHYNRGNALARAGDLKGALAAYDRALAHDPDDADTRHNRDLVAKALEQPKGQDPKAGDNQGGDQKDRGDQTDQNQDPSRDAGDSGQKGNASQDEQGQQPKDGDQAGEQAQGEQQPSPSGSGAQPEPQPDGARGQDSAQQNPASADKPPRSEAEEAEQARRDAQAALASQQAAQQDPAQSGEQAAMTPGDAARQGATQGAASRPQRTEAQLAQEQWLRRIPDDPGGLLRRKFQIEHLRRQGQEPDAPEDAP
ncbi:MAG TPA: tetratricopeptide repeat protein [Nevskiaceae bacterium]|nr:tetratricopeptide repeat protein [Nevskiaceae bacterium]